MFSVGPKGFRERVNNAFAVAVKRKNSDYFVQEQLRTKLVAPGVFCVVQKVLLSNPDMWRDLLEEKTFEEFDEEKYNRDRMYHSKLEKSLSDFHLETNLLSAIVHNGERNILNIQKSCM
jgi:hypothetical protein